MKVDNSISAWHSAPTGAKPAFGAIHPTKYYIMGANNQFQLVTEPELIKTLQRKIIGMLNHYLNNARLRQVGKVPKEKSPSEKKLLDRLVKFFVRNDKDYDMHAEACSFYNVGENKEFKPYILTGKTVTTSNQLGKPIGKLKGSLKKDATGLTDEMRARSESNLSRAQSEYYSVLNDMIAKEVTPESMTNTEFGAYFIPVKGKKGTFYELHDAVFSKRMRHS